MVHKKKSNTVAQWRAHKPGFRFMSDKPHVKISYPTQQCVSVDFTTYDPLYYLSL